MVFQDIITSFPNHISTLHDTITPFPNTKNAPFRTQSTTFRTPFRQIKTQISNSQTQTSPLSDSDVPFTDMDFTDLQYIAAVIEFAFGVLHDEIGKIRCKNGGFVVYFRHVHA